MNLRRSCLLLLSVALMSACGSAWAQQNAGVDTYSCDFWDGKTKKPGGQYVVDRKNQTATGKGIKGKAWVVVSPLSHEIFAKDGKLKLTINRQTGAAALWTETENQWLHGKCSMK